MKTQSILLVDDDPIVLKSLGRNPGLQVSVAKSAKDAVADISNRYYDLVVTDLMMPVLEGFQVVKAAKQWSGIPAKVIILTVGKRSPGL